MILEYDPKVNLQHYPLPTRRFGLNPFGEPLYRIVFASSRRNLAGPAWPGETEFQWVPSYPAVKAAWVLERWHSAFEFTGMTRTSWDYEMVERLGPYPARGEYSLVWEFNLGVDADSLDKIVGVIEGRHRHSAQELRDFNAAEYAAEDKQTHAAVYGEIKESQRAWGSRPFAGAHGSRGSKTSFVPVLTAEQAGMPVPRRMPPPKRVSRRTDVRDIQVRNTMISGGI